MVHVPTLFQELDALEAKGINTKGRIFVSASAHVVFDLHQKVDGLEEAALGKAKVGTTGKGIGPCYSSKMARHGIQIGQLAFNEEKANQKLRNLGVASKARYGDLLKYDVEEEIKQLNGFREKLQPLIVDAVGYVVAAQRNGEKILIEGANALMLDVSIAFYRRPESH